MKKVKEAKIKNDLEAKIENHEEPNKDNTDYHIHEMDLTKRNKVLETAVFLDSSAYRR